MSIYQLCYSFWELCFAGAETSSIASWCPLFAMVSVGALIFGVFLSVAKIFK